MHGSFSRRWRVIGRARTPSSAYLSAAREGVVDAKLFIAASRGLTDYSLVDKLSLLYTSVNFAGRKDVVDADCAGQGSLQGTP